MSTGLLTLLAIVAFAANSVLCRMALGDGLIDPISFTIIRLASGALVLTPLAMSGSLGRRSWLSAGSWVSGIALVAYAAMFSLAYLSLAAGTGALILFGCVQATMIGAALLQGERPGRRRWAGVLIASAGLLYLVSPGLAAPDGTGAALMTIAGIAWGVYSLRGRRMDRPVAATAANFGRAILLAFPLLAVVPWVGHASAAGVGLAAVSGAVTSGLGYVIWYAALPHLTATQAAVVQLLVPAVAALGGVVVLGEAVSFRLVAASLLILGGIGAAVLGPGTPARRPAR